MKERMAKPLMMIIALLIAVIMVRLGVWQLGRAEEKQAILDGQISASTMQPVSLNSYANEAEFEQLVRFRPVAATGHYAHELSILIDNQVLDSRVGYRLFTPFNLAGNDWWVMVDRGWVPVGEDRAKLPPFDTEPQSHRVLGRFNMPPAKPPLWNASTPVSVGDVWQYLPIDIAAHQLNLKLLPMVLELATDFDREIDANLIRRWQKIDDKWVAMHHGYAFQWFAMALAFLLACVILALRSTKPKTTD